MSKPKDLTSLLLEYAADSPEKVLFVHEGRHIQVGDVVEKVERLSAALLGLGITKGSRVLLMLPNVPEYVISYYAILRIGGVVVPANVLLRERELHYLMDDCEANAIIAPSVSSPDVVAAAEALDSRPQVIFWGDNAPDGFLRLERLIEEHGPTDSFAFVMPDDTAAIMYTAGTTGRPKGAVLTHYNLLGNTRACVKLINLKPRDRLIGLIPFFHAFGQTAVMNTALAAGASVVLVPRFDPEETMRAVKDYLVTVFVAVPTVYSILLSHSKVDSFDFSSVRYCISGGSALKPELLWDFQKRFSLTILEGYGLAEATAVATFNHLRQEPRPGSIGTPIEGVEVVLMDDNGNQVLPGQVGEIAIRGEYIMKGYLNRPEATRKVMQGGWFRTGDLARQDEDGYLYIVDRKTDMIVKSGFNVYPREIEELLLDHPAISEAAVIGVPDPVQGEAVKVCIVLRSGAQLSAEEIAAFCRQKLARYKCPRYVQFYQQLPKSPSGRILKKKLRENSKQ